MTQTCSGCKYRTEYVAVENQDHSIFICNGVGWADGDDGSYELMEVSNFDATGCLLFGVSAEATG